MVLSPHHHQLGTFLVAAAIAAVFLLSSAAADADADDIHIAHTEHAKGHKKRRDQLRNHKGPLLTGDVQLAIMWYGIFPPAYKDAVKSFLSALAPGAPVGPSPSVADWWRVVESYQLTPEQIKANAPPPPIRITVANEVEDGSCAKGKIITTDYLPPMMNTATGGNNKAVSVIFTGDDVSMHGLCLGQCSMHNVEENMTYIVVGNPETLCPDACGWPYVKSCYFPGDIILKPVRGAWAADVLVLHLASGLASTVTNPERTGWYGGFEQNPKEAGTACEGRFGKGASKGNPGIVGVDPVSGGAYNAHGKTAEEKFLLPGLWNPVTQACYSLM